MKKIPTLFTRYYADHKVVGISDEVTPGCEAVLEGKCRPTIKIDGACCAIINGEFYKRYDAKKGRKPPEGAIPCCDPDPVTGHWPHWVKVDPNRPEDKWFMEAYNNSPWYHKQDGTYEAYGKHFQGNPYSMTIDKLIPHGNILFRMPRKPTFENIKKSLEECEIEGIVFWKDGKPLCKIKRTDFGLEWPIKSETGDR